MEVVIILKQFNEHHHITVSDIEWLTDNKKEVYHYLLLNPHRDFAISLLNTLMALRIEQPGEHSAEDLMFACLLVAIHRHEEDCLLIWKAKTTDFDAFCLLDIQMMAFMGVAATIAYLQTSADPAASEALKYVQECEESEDFDELDNYFSSIDLHWCMG